MENKKHYENLGSAQGWSYLGNKKYENNSNRRRKRKECVERWEFRPELQNRYKDSKKRKKAKPIEALYHKAIQYKLLTAEQERGEDGLSNEDQRRRLVLHNLRLVINIGLRYIGPRKLDIEDIVQEGILGLIIAANKYDPKRGARFATYASIWIKSMIERAIKRDNNLIIWPPHRSELYKANRRLENNDGWPDEKDKMLKAGERAVEYLNGTIECNSITVYPNEPIEEHTGQLQETLQKWFTKRDQKIIKMKYGIGYPKEMTLQEIGAELGVTRERIRQIILRIMIRLKQVLPKDIKETYMDQKCRVSNG